MKGIDSRDWIIIILGIISSIIIAFLLKLQKIDFKNFQATDILLILGVAIIAVVFVFYRKIREINDELDNQEKEQKRICEKLKIHEQLIDMKAEIKELQKRCKI
jgi:SNF family Na+-dependent transporter